MVLPVALRLCAPHDRPQVHGQVVPSSNVGAVFGMPSLASSADQQQWERNWAKGWIIEDNVIHDSKCSGVSLGKEGSTGHNHASERGDKPGYQYQLESVFSARHIGWDREHIGSHIVRRNTIFDCGQTGIVGHLGSVFSTIDDNHIHDIAAKREFYGHEIAGIKLHAAIDVEIRHNRIHGRSLGTWLDWETQGHTRHPQPVRREPARPVHRGQPRPLHRGQQRLRFACRALAL